MRRRDPIVLAVLTAVLVVACVDLAATAPPGAPASPSAATAATSIASSGQVTPSPEPTQAEPPAAGSPPSGQYRCYLVPNYIYNGYVDLGPAGTYQAGFTLGVPTTSGSYVFDSPTRLIRWNGGSYAENWPMAYYVEPHIYPDGSSREGTGSDRPTIALKVDQSSPLLPGQEVGGNPVYVYCYLEPA